MVGGGVKPDLGLVIAVQRGDASATSALLRAVWPDAYRIARSMLRDHGAAEDTAQEACARVLTSIARLRRPERFAVWFANIVANEAKSRMRRMRREREAVEIASAEGGDDERIDVQRAIEALPPMLRATVVLRHYYGFDSGEIGAILGIAPVTARWRLMLAHRRLRASLAPHISPGGA